MPLPTDRDERNAAPVWDGCIAYFPDTWAEIAKVSVLGNVQHGLGAKLHFARDVSTDHLNKVMRHCLDHQAGTVFDDGGKTRHLAKAAWRILAALQVSIENDAKVVATVPAGTQEPEIIPGLSLAAYRAAVNAKPVEYPPHWGAPVRNGKCDIGSCWRNDPEPTKG